MAPLALLPCLRRGSNRWWLPLSTVATESLGQVLLLHGRRAGLLDRSTCEQLVQALQDDPPLAIYSALCWTGEQAELCDLADWLFKNAAGCFASGNAYMGAPSIDEQHLRRWRKLYDHFRTLPINEWMADAHLWLEVTGPKVAQAWREQWPQIVLNCSERKEVGYQNSSSMLQQLARMMQRQRSLEQSFDERLHKSKLGALKQLAYGLSHEINNPLANISTRAQQLQRNEDDPTRCATLQRIVDQVYRAHEMIADLMFYANPPDPNPRLCDLNRVVQGVVEGFEEEAQRQAIRLEVDTYDDGDANADVDGTMIGEAIRALIRNSIDAIGCDGTIVVSLVRQERRWLIHVADSGPGLSALAREHAFDPYFSGREAGRGLGLGLCRAYRIARLHTGDITLAGGPTGCVATIELNV